MPPQPLARDKLGQSDGGPDTDGGSEQHGDACRQRRTHDQDASAVLTGGRRPGSRPDEAQPIMGERLSGPGGDADDDSDCYGGENGPAQYVSLDGNAALPAALSV